MAIRAPDGASKSTLKTQNPFLNQNNLAGRRAPANRWIRNCTQCASSSLYSPLFHFPVIFCQFFPFSVNFGLVFCFVFFFYNSPCHRPVALKVKLFSALSVLIFSFFIFYSTLITTISVKFY